MYGRKSRRMSALQIISYGYPVIGGFILLTARPFNAASSADTEWSNTGIQTLRHPTDALGVVGWRSNHRFHRPSYPRQLKLILMTHYHHAWLWHIEVGCCWRPWSCHRDNRHIQIWAIFFVCETAIGELPRKALVVELSRMSRIRSSCWTESVEIRRIRSYRQSTASHHLRVSPGENFPFVPTMSVEAFCRQCSAKAFRISIDIT